MSNRGLRRISLNLTQRQFEELQQLLRLERQRTGENQTPARYVGRLLDKLAQRLLPRPQQSPSGLPHSEVRTLSEYSSVSLGQSTNLVGQNNSDVTEPGVEYVPKYSDEDILRMDWSFGSDQALTG